METEEAYAHRRPDLVNVVRVDDQHGPSIKAELVTRLSAIAPDFEHLRDDEVLDFNDRMRARIDRGDDLTAVLAFFKLNLMTCEDHELPSLIEYVHTSIRQWNLQGTDTAAFPDARVYVATPTDALRHRGRLPAIMLRFQQDPALASELGSVQDLPAGEAFSSAGGMLSAMTLLEPFLGPLLGCASPRVWVVPATRTIGVTLLVLGATIRGVSGDPVEPLQLLPAEQTPGDTGGPAGEVHDGFTGRTCDEAIHWWVTRLNQMCSYLSDPTVFSDSTGHYSAGAHLSWMLTFEQLFLRVSAVQVEHRNVTARRTVAFGALDILADRFDYHSIDNLCSLKREEKTLQPVRDRMPAAAQTVLMPQADRAVAALRTLQSGFFIARQRGTDTVDVVLADGTTQCYTRDGATATLLRVLRNSTHGFGSAKTTVDSAAVLAHHDGQIPPDVYLLPYLYLLDLLCKSEHVGPGITRRESRAPSTP